MQSVEFRLLENHPKASIVELQEAFYFTMLTQKVVVTTPFYTIIFCLPCVVIRGNISSLCLCMPRLPKPMLKMGQ